MADNQRVEDPGQELKDKSLAEFAERTKGKPTPTQDENNRAALGEHVIDKEPDGSNPDPTPTNPAGTTNRMMSAERGGNPAVNQSGAKSPAPGSPGYNTRQTQPANPNPNKTE